MLTTMYGRTPGRVRALRELRDERVRLGAHAAPHVLEQVEVVVEHHARHVALVAHVGRRGEQARC
jgi:hypothetical protein